MNRVFEKDEKQKWLRIGYVILMFTMTLLVVGLLAYNLKNRIKNSYCVVSYMESSEIQEINPGETWDVEYSMDNSEFATISFFIMQAISPEMHLKMVNETTGEVYYNDTIHSNQFVIDEANGRTEVVITVGDTNIPSKLFSKGTYHLYFTNKMENDNISLSVLDNGNINVMIMNTTYIGYWIALLVALLLLLYLGCVWIFLKKNNLSAERFFLISVIPLSIIYLILLLPWSAPDVDVHVIAAYRWSNLMMGKDAWVGRVDDVIYYDSYWRDNPKIVDYLAVFSNLDVRVKDATLIPWTEPAFGMDYYYRMEYYSFLCYLPQSIGICIARILGLGTVWTLYFGRLCMLIVYIAACYNAVRKTPIGKFVFAAIPLFPISLMMGSAISYDPMVLISTLNFIACVLNLDINGSSKKMLAECCLWAVLIGAVKGGGYVVLLPISLVLLKKDNLKQSIKRIFLIIGSGILSIFLFDVIIPAGTTLFQFGGKENYFSAGYALEHPLQYINMCVETFFEKVDFIATTMGGSLLSWLEGTIPSVIVYGLILVVGIYSIYESDKCMLKNKEKYIFIFVIILDVVLTPIMLLSWTPIDYKYIEGLQGRYFLPVLPLLYFVLTKYNLHVNFEQKDNEQLCIIQKKCIVLFTILSCLCVFCMMRLYLMR